MQITDSPVYMNSVYHLNFTLSPYLYQALVKMWQVNLRNLLQPVKETGLYVHGMYIHIQLAVPKPEIHRLLCITEHF